MHTLYLYMLGMLSRRSLAKSGLVGVLHDLRHIRRIMRFWMIMSGCMMVLCLSDHHIEMPYISKGYTCA